MTLQHRFTSILSTLLVAGLFSAPQLRAQQSNPATPQQAPETSQQPQQPTNVQPAQTNQAPSTTQQAPATNTQPAPQGQSQPQQPSGSGTTVNPSQAPLQPVTTYPDASGTQQGQQPTAPAQTNVPEGPQPKQQPSEPVGAATAESVPTAGGAAAKPAGVAIAPAKQHQTRSLMLKVGAAVAAGAALGTILALSHGTSSTPPGANAAGVVPR
jgi:hypothetical protein